MTTYVARGGAAYTVYWQGQVLGVLVRSGGRWVGRKRDGATVSGPSRDACARAMLPTTTDPGYTE